MYRNKTAKQKNFAVVPRADIPRSKFAMRQTRKQAFNASELVPIMVEEVLPGDVWQHRENIMARFATPIAPAVDDIDLETFYFFVPNRLVWDEWEDFITGSESVTTPLVALRDNTGANNVVILNGVPDHMGLPIGTYTTSVFVITFPILSYFTIWNEWFRDQNLQLEWTWPDTNVFGSEAIVQGTAIWNQQCLRVNKRHDYFTSSLPFAQKGAAVQLPLGSTAPVVPTGDGIPSWSIGAGTFTIGGNDANLNVEWSGVPDAAPEASWDQTKLVADLSAATAATINQIRLAFQTQKLLERDARGGSRYVEQILSHFGVRSPDYRLQRPEYLGGSKLPVNVNPVAQTAQFTADPGVASAIGNLGGEMHASGSKRTFSYAATEHGYIIGLCTVRATPTYQQGIRRHWRRSTRLDYYFPVFAHLGEQAVRTEEIFFPASTVPTNATWGFQERWAEYRYTPNEITGVLRGTAPQPLDWWHYAEEFATEPALNGTFMLDKTQETLSRSLATFPSAQWSAQIIMDILHESTVARMMPTYSVPGLIDHF